MYLEESFRKYKEKIIKRYLLPKALLLQIGHAMNQYSHNILFNNLQVAEDYCATAPLFILGTAYVHPYITYPTFSYQRSFLPHIRTFEASDGFAQIYEAVVTQDGGRKKVIRKNDEGKTKEYEYFWKKVGT